MEKQIKSFSEIEKAGQVVLIKNPIIGDNDVAVCSGIHETYKYPIGDSNGRKSRSLGRVKNKLKFVYADEVGDTGNEMIKEYFFTSNVAGDYTFKEDDDPTKWNVRLIDSKHKLYDKNFSKFGSKFDRMINMFASLDNTFDKDPKELLDIIDGPKKKFNSFLNNSKKKIKNK